MSYFTKEAKRGILRRLSVFSISSQKQFDRQTSCPETSRTSSYFDQWRYNQPVDVNDPMSIKRNFDRRETLDSIWKSRDSICEDIGSLDDDDEEIESKQTKEFCTQFSLLTSPIDKYEKHEHSYVNNIFKESELNQHDAFMSAFGKKGREVGEFQDVKDITTVSDGDLLISDLINDRVQICSHRTASVTIFAPDEIKQPYATAVTPDGNIAVTSCKERCVKLLNMKGEYIFDFGHRYFVRPTGLAVDSKGNFIICDSVIDKVSIFDRNGNFIRFLGNSFILEECFSSPRYVCVSKTGEIIVSDCGHHKIKVFDPEGHFIRSFGSFGKGEQQFKCPYGVSTNKYGDIFAADHYNSRISLFSRDGIFIRHVVTSEHGLVHPQGLNISSDLHMYISHGHLKANEILVYKLTDCLNYEYSNRIYFV